MASVRSSRFTRLVVLVWMVAGVLLLTGLIRALIALGVFTTVTPVALACRAITLQGPGDLAADAQSHTLFIAASDRRAQNNPADGLYYLPFGGTAVEKMTGGPADFHPQSLSLSRDASGPLILMVVDRKSSGRIAIESFSVAFDTGNPRLVYGSAIQSGLVTRPGGIAALGAQRFYLANGPAKNGLIAWLDRYALLPRSDVLYFNGMMFREAVAGLTDPSAIALSPDGKRLFVASRNERRVIGFSLDAFSGDLKEMGALALPLRPEHMTVDAKGNVWIAGAPKLPALRDYDKDPIKPAPSQVVRVTVGPGGVPLSFQTVYADDGPGIGAASAAAAADGHLFIGSALDHKFLDCAQP